MDIVIYMNEEDFKHKTGQKSKHDDEEGQICAFWEMKRIPRYFNQTDEDDDRIFLACKGFVRGSMECDEFNPNHPIEETIKWDSNSWIPLKKVIPCKPFRGFRYRWWKLPKVEL